MKNRFQSFSSLLALGVALGLISWGGSLHAQQTPPQSQQPMPETQQPAQQQPPAQAPDQNDKQTATPDQQTTTPAQQPSSQPSQPEGQTTQPPAGQTTQPPDSQAQTTDASGVQTFTGTIVKQGDKYVLQDAASGSTYDIDHQDEVKKFEGKKVRVHGTLDASAKMIHVQ